MSRRWSATRTRWWPHWTLIALDERTGSALALLVLVVGQEVEPAEGNDGRDGRRRIARRVAEDRTISTVDPEDSGAYLLKFAWTKITRHTLVKGWASPDGPALASYWADRRRRRTPPLDPARLRLLQRQRGRCPLCGELLLHARQEPQHPDEWEQWIKAVRAATRPHSISFDAAPGKPGGHAVYRLTHAYCSRRQPGADPQFRLQVSPRLRAEFGNGDQFYAKAGQVIELPEHRTDRPSREFLEWHLDTVFHG